MNPNEAAFHRALDEALERADEESRRRSVEVTPRGRRLVEQKLQEMFSGQN